MVTPTPLYEKVIQELHENGNPSTKKGEFVGQDDLKKYGHSETHPNAWDIKSESHGSSKNQYCTNALQ